MSLLRRLSAAGVLAVAALPFLAVAPADATDFPVTQSCDGTTHRLEVTSGDTVTVTLAGSCSATNFIDQDSTGATATLNGAPLPAGTSTPVVTGDTVVITIPATGIGVVQLVSYSNMTGYSVRITASAPTTTTSTTSTVVPDPITPTYTG